MLFRRRKDGTTERDHLVALQNATGKTPPELEIPPVPPGTEALLHAFEQLHAARPAGGFGIASIPLTEVIAWQTAMGVRLTPWEVETLLYLDRAALAAMMD